MKSLIVLSVMLLLLLEDKLFSYVLVSTDTKQRRAREGEREKKETPTDQLVQLGHIMINLLSSYISVYKES